jgi:RNA polymerase sigma-54 factor
MTMELDFQQTQSPYFGEQQSVRVSHRLVASSSMLELSSQELQQAIAQELHDNPALEVVDIPTCRVCGTDMQGSICPRCIQRQKVDSHTSYEFDPNSSTYDGVPDNHASDDDDFDPFTRVAAEQTLSEKLMADMGAVLPEADLPIVEYLIGSLDDKGYLSVKVEDVAFDLDADVDRVRAILRVLQSEEPIGIGARNLRECLLIQIDHLDERGLSQPYAREIVSQFLSELGEHKFARIARELKVRPAVVSAAWDFVKHKLNPHPGLGFSSTNVSDRETRAMYITPDVTITRGVDDFEIDVIESRRFALRINPMYTRLATDLQRHGASMNSDEKKHVQQYVGRAKLFIANINQRRQTMLRITTCIVERQRAYLDRGVRFLQPLSRAGIADELGLHESTVSRATASKYVMLPNSEVIPYSHFFTPSLSVKDVMKELIEKEGKPLTDNDILERLGQDGIHIARRTVAKYRMQLDILPSALR